MDFKESVFSILRSKTWDIKVGVTNVSILRVESLPAFCAKKKLDQKVKKNLIKKSRIELVF